MDCCKGACVCCRCLIIPLVRGDGGDGGGDSGGDGGGDDTARAWWLEMVMIIVGDAIAVRGGGDEMRSDT